MTYHAGRDRQQRRVYDAESAAIPSRHVTRVGATRWVERLCRHVRRVPPGVVFTTRSSGWYRHVGWVDGLHYPNGVIGLPRTSIPLAHVVHEVAHHVDRDREGAHGAGFITAHLDLVAVAFGQIVADRLTMAYVEHGCDLSTRDYHARTDALLTRHAADRDREGEKADGFAVARRGGNITTWLRSDYATYRRVGTRVPSDALVRRTRVAAERMRDRYAPSFAVVPVDMVWFGRRWMGKGTIT